VGRDILIVLAGVYNAITNKRHTEGWVLKHLPLFYYD